MRKTLTILLLLCSINIYAQKQYNNWYFGTYLGMKFDGSSMSVVPPNLSKMYAPYGASSWSDPQTGQLRFYTNGAYVYDKNHNQMPNGFYINKETLAPHAYIVPDPGNANLFYVISSNTTGGSLYYSVVDMRLNNGLGDVTRKAVPLGDVMINAFTVVRQAYDQGYWLITHRAGKRDFLIYAINKDGLDTIPVTYSEGGPTPSDKPYINGKMVSSSDGSMIVLTSGADFAYSVEVFNFDKRCGVISYRNRLEPVIMQAELVIAYPAFSPDNKLLYISYLHNTGQDQVIQYDLADPDPNSSKEVLYNGSFSAGDLQLAPDGKIYMASAENAAVTARINVINKPNQRGNATACDFRIREFNLSGTNTHFTEHFVEYISDIQPQLPGYTKPQPVFANTCGGQPVSFSIADSFTADSFIWDFGDGTFSRILETEHQYAELKNYTVTFRWYLCNRKYEITDTIKLRFPPDVKLGNDTTLCSGKNIMLTAPLGAEEYRWSTGDSTYFLLVDTPGTYSVSVRNGECWGSDEIRVNYYDPIWLALGDEFFICDKEKELVKLDAGEGFSNYKWTPTEDTTQWIIVGDLGAYFVIVKDFRGCNGDDGTKVKRRCPVSVYFPNVFTPNGDGLNDLYVPVGLDVMSFHMTIYNRWGQLVFETDHIDKKWDGTFKGKPLAEDVYIYNSEYSGYVNKQFRMFDHKGNLTLIR